MALILEQHLPTSISVCLHSAHALGKYYPAVSSYMGGKATFNFGPKFKHAMPNGATAFCEAQHVSFWPRPEKSQAHLSSDEDNVVKKKEDQFVKEEIKEEATQMEVDQE